MAISTHFQDEINEVDATKTLVFHSGEAGYGDLEWSYDGLDIYGGTDLACEHGASALLYEMGFRFYSPNESFYYRPASIPTNLTATKQSFWFPDLSIWLAYGHSWSDIHAASRTLLGQAYAKWQRLNACAQNTRPAGHRWGNIISKNAAYFAENPQFLINGDPDSFDLATLQDAVDQTDYTNLVNVCASEMLKQGLNEWNRTNFDPSDGDNNTSDRVFPFTKDVVDAMRAGTPEIQLADTTVIHPARAGNPDAEIGLYAYAGHRLPPTNSVSPGVYTQVALAFNNTEYSYLELVQLHGAKADAILLRDYLDTQVWSQSKPFSASVRVSNDRSNYDAFRDAGAIGENSEFAANWLNNLAGTAHVLRKFKTGTSNYFTVLQEMVNLIFNGDQAVYDLYVLFGDEKEAYSLTNLKRCFDIISRMQDGWYKTLFKYWAVIQYEFAYLPAQTPLLEQDASDPFPAAFSKFMSHVVAVRDLDITHSYATMRQQANGAVTTNYPDLWMSAVPKPAWFTDPVLPTDYDFSRCYELITAATARDVDLDSTDLVLVKGVQPLYPAPVTNPPAGDGFAVQGAGKFKIVGPAEITVTTDGVAVPYSFDEGIHDFYVPSGIYTVEVVSGYAFLDMYGRTRYEGAKSGTNSWLYVPSRCDGAVGIITEVRIVVNDGTGELDITNLTDPAVIAQIRPGQVWIQGLETRGTHYFTNCNRYISLRPDVILIPRILAEEDFPTLIKMRRPGSVPDVTPPTTPGTPTVTTQTSSSIGITWAKSTDTASAVSYKIYRDDVFVGSSHEPSYVDTGLDPSTQYTYYVVAADVSGNTSAASGTVNGTTVAADVTAPTAPTNLAVEDVTQSTVTISWTASTDAVGVAGYYIYRDSTLVATRSSPRFVDSGLTPETQYVYTVSAYDDAGNESAQSSSVSPTTDVADVVAPTTPTNFAVTLETVETVAFSWTASTDNVGVAGYRVYQYDPDLDDYEVAQTSTTTSATVGGLAPGSTYSFKVSAYDAAGNESALSAAIEGTTT